MTKKQATTINVLIITVIVLGALVSSRFWFRLDFTKNKLYTISAVSRNLRNEIPDQIRITYYLSDKLKAMHPVPGEIEDLLREYAAFSRGKIRLTVRDPAKANLVNQVEQIGILPRQIQTVEQDQASIMTVYSGLVIEHLDQIDVLPLVFSPDTLEYDLTSRIRAMVRERSRQLGVIAGGNPRSWNEEYRPLQGFLMQAGYNFRLISPGEDIPDTVPALLVLGGVESLNEYALYQIDRYIQNGGRVFFSVKSVGIDKENSMEAGLLYDNGLLEMISSYGVTVLPEIAMDRNALTMQYQTQTRTGAVQFRIIRNPQWIRVAGENGNPDHPVSANFSGLDLYWANPLSLHAPEGVEAEYLFTGTDNGWSMKEPYTTNPEMSYLMDRDASETMGKKILGASLTGIFPSRFKDRPKPSGEDISELPDMPDEAKPARIIVVGETDFLTSFIGVTDGQQNMDFIILAADWLTNDDDIIGIRNRNSGSGRLDRITDPEKRAAAMSTARIVNVFIIPLLVVIAGVLHALKRRTKTRSRAVIEADKDGVPNNGVPVNGVQVNGGAKEFHDDV